MGLIDGWASGFQQRQDDERDYNRHLEAQARARQMQLDDEDRKYQREQAALRRELSPDVDEAVRKTFDMRPYEEYVRKGGDPTAAAFMAQYEQETGQKHPDFNPGWMPNSDGKFDLPKMVGEAAGPQMASDRPSLATRFGPEVGQRLDAERASVEYGTPFPARVPSIADPQTPAPPQGRQPLVHRDPAPPPQRQPRLTQQDLLDLQYAGRKYAPQVPGTGPRPTEDQIMIDNNRGRLKMEQMTVAHGNNLAKLAEIEHGLNSRMTENNAAQYRIALLRLQAVREQIAAAWDRLQSGQATDVDKEIAENETAIINAEAQAIAKILSTPTPMYSPEAQDELGKGKTRIEDATKKKDEAQERMRNRPKQPAPVKRSSGSTSGAKTQGPVNPSPSTPPIPPQGGSVKTEVSKADGKPYYVIRGPDGKFIDAVPVQ